MRTTLCTIGVLISGLACAQDRGGPRGGQMGEGGFMRFHPLLSALDVNHDGVISAEEMANAPAILKTLDRNGDGQITPDEMRPTGGPGGRGMGAEGRGGGPERENGGGPGMEGRRRGPRAEGDRPEGGPPGGGAPGGDMMQSLMQFDKNGDGKLSRDEVPERMQGMFDRGDLNKDGVLDQDELAKLAQSRPGPGGQGGPGGRRMDHVFAALDTDHDGVLSAAEIANAGVSLKALDKDGDGKLIEAEVRPNFRPRE